MSANAGRPDLDLLLRAQHIPVGEPIFYLRARDPGAETGVRAWAARAFELGAPAAVIEQGLQQADAIASWPEKRLPDVHHLKRHEILQLEYQLRRRAWRAREDGGPTETAILLAEQRGYARALSELRRGGI
ncbi:MAG TPA: hypothetical protein VG248_17425 [Caulobacteraceae bacterium]|jgi:hypothetical protein|nr:hypothetical protein [Caulobacteraceae bacterium]